MTPKTTAPASSPASFSAIEVDTLNSNAINAKTISAQAICLPPVEDKPMDLVQYLGLVGDFFGGVIGTIFAAITLFYIYSTWRTTREIDYKTKTYQVFAEMMRTHEEIVSSFEIGETRGRDAIAAILSEFSFIYKLANKLTPYNPLTVHQKIDISFAFLYYGPYKHTQKILKAYDPILIKSIKDAIFRKQQSNAKSRAKRDRVRQFKGHQNPGRSHLNSDHPQDRLQVVQIPSGGATLALNA